MYNKLLEAVNRGIKLALDDYENSEIKDLKSGQIEDKSLSKDIIWILEILKDFVDLGLPSGTLWCKYNIGCDWDRLNKDPKHTNLEDWHGDYYAWGETESKNSYSWTNYKFSDIDKWVHGTSKNYNLLKYCTNKKFGVIDNLTELEPEDDICKQINSSYSFPSLKDFEELIENTEYEFVKNYLGVNNLNGVLLKSKNNSNKLFIPQSGSYSGLRCTDKSVAYLWTSSLDENRSNNAYVFLFNHQQSGMAYGLPIYDTFINIAPLSRCFGMQIRPIVTK